MTTTIREALSAAAARLAAAGIGTPARDARRLMAHCLGVDMAALTVRLGEMFASDAQARFDEMLFRRLSREPVSHILGYRDFWRSRFRVTPDVLDPRPETELLVSLALTQPFARVLDLGTGSGAILISLLLERPEAKGVGTDISSEAVLIAGENAERLGVSDRITLPISDWFEDVGGRYDLIVSNPPYIGQSEIADLDPEVRDHEPRLALTDGADGLTAYRHIAEHAGRLLVPGGRLLVEIGPTQADAVIELFQTAGLDNIEQHADFDGRPRVVSAHSPQNTAQIT